MSLTRRRFIWKSGVGLVGSVLTTGVYAWCIEPHWVEVVERQLPVAQLPATLSGKRLVQITDLHVGPRVDDDYLIASLDRVRDLRPEILVVTGDIVSRHIPAVGSSLEPLASWGTCHVGNTR